MRNHNYTVYFYICVYFQTCPRILARVPRVGGQNQTLHPYQQKLLSNKVKFQHKSITNAEVWWKMTERLELTVIFRILIKK